MIVNFFNIATEIPDAVVNKYVKEFNGLAGSRHRDVIIDLRDYIWEILEFVYDNPDELYDKECAKDFVKAMAMKEALVKHGIWFDA